MCFQSASSAGAEEATKKAADDKKGGKAAAAPAAAPAAAAAKKGGVAAPPNSETLVQPPRKTDAEVEAERHRLADEGLALAGEMWCLLTRAALDNGQLRVAQRAAASAVNLIPESSARREVCCCVALSCAVGVAVVRCAKGWETT